MTEITPEQIRSAARILDSCLYAVIATVNDDGTAWNSPVFFCRNKQNILYWASSLESRHSSNILRDNRVSIVVFDPNAPWGKGSGVYLSATVSVVENSDEIDAVRQLRMEKAEKASQSADQFRTSSPRRLFKAVPSAAWINTEVEISGVVVDQRLPVPLETLTSV